MKPVKYTMVEGGVWNPWPVDLPFQDIWLSRRSEDATRMGPIWVHTIIMHNGRRWDCVNGFTS